jgi:hypothetical protein
MHFEIVSEINQVEIIAEGNSIRILAILRERYGDGRWRKLKGVASIALLDGTIHLAEIHWFEAHGIGKKMMKIKRFVD